MSEKIVAVDRALDILLYLYNKEEEAGISEMSRELDLPKSTVHRTLSTLEDRGFVAKNEISNNYWLGMSLYSLGSMVGDKMDLVDIIDPYLKELHDKVREVINVSILERGMDGEFKTVMIYKLEDNSNVLSVNPKLGSRSDVHTSSVGKCLLAFSKKYNEEDMKDMELREHTANTIVDWEDFSKELEKVREQGYAVDNEEQEMGLFCVGAPIFNKDSEAIAAVSISGPTTRMKNDKLDEKIDMLLKTVGEINKVTSHVS